jgi:hypothetical protein
MALQAQLDSPLRRVQDSRSGSRLLSRSAAFIQDPGGYMDIDNLSIVTIASSEVKRVLTGAVQQVKEVAAAVTTKKLTVADTRIQKHTDCVSNNLEMWNGQGQWSL